MDSSITWAGITLPTPLAAALIGAVSAAAVSLVTLVFTTWIAGARFRAQLKHDRQQKNEDRKSAIRREVYLRAVASTQEALAKIGNLADRDHTEDPPVGLLNDFMTAMSQVSLVAESAAALLARELIAQMNELFFKALPLAVSYRLAIEDMPRLKAQLATMNEEQKRIAIEIARSWERNEPAEVRERLLRSDDRFGELRGLAQNKLHAVAEAAEPLRKQFANELLDAGGDARTTFMRLVSALRREIHLEPLEAELLERTEQDRIRVESIFRGVGLRKG
jgi:hypothetical protein